MSGWSESAVIYQAYPRSFQDSNGDGIGDLAGIASRLDHLEWLGVDAIWLSPIYPSPNADWGYDVTDHATVDPVFGTAADFDELIAEAHGRGIRVLLDLVVSHTSIEHPWFRERPDFYVWADGPEPPNNWVAAFGGPAWSLDSETGRLYLHSFYPEQPDLDWGNPEVRDAMGDVIRSWIERGADGFRVDAVQMLSKDPALRSDPDATEPFPLPLPPEAMALNQIHSRNHGDVSAPLVAVRAAAGEAALIGEVYLPAASLGPYLEEFDSVFAFDLLHAAWDSASLGRAVERSGEAGRVAWVTSNHDFPRAATRWGPENTRAAAVLLLTLGGTAVVYQGEEIGMEDGSSTEPVRDRYGRDPCRTPMQWEPEPRGGFTTGEPWLPLADPELRSVAAQRGDPESLANLFRRLIALRRDLSGLPEPVAAEAGVLAFRRGRHLIAINTHGEPRVLPPAGSLVLESERGAVGDGVLAPHGAAVLKTTDGTSGHSV